MCSQGKGKATIYIFDIMPPMRGYVHCITMVEYGFNSTCLAKCRKLIIIRIVDVHLTLNGKRLVVKIPGLISVKEDDFFSWYENESEN